MNANIDKAFIKLEKLYKKATDGKAFDAIAEIKFLESDTTAAEKTSDADTDLVSFDSDGFTLGASNHGNVNASSVNYVGWNWKAASTASGTTSGAGTGKAYSARYNTDAGFSIIGYLGNGTADHTIPHHLGKKPQFITVKKRSGSGAWCTYNETITADKHIVLNSTAYETATHQYWSETEPTSSVFTVWSNAENNENDESYIAYCWTSIDGYSKVGFYKGNASADGPFIYTGFRPAYILVKKATNVASWHIFDAARDTDNDVKEYLKADSTAAEATSAAEATIFDFVSNGLKIRGSSGDMNSNNETYIYLAFSESCVWRFA